MHKAMNKSSIGSMGLCSGNVCEQEWFLIPLMDFINDKSVNKFLGSHWGT